MYSVNEYYVKLGGSHNSELTEQELEMLLRHGLDLPVETINVEGVE